MSTRANFIVTDGSLNEGTYQFYSHYDGYPSGLGHDLAKLINAAKPQNLKNAATLAKYFKDVAEYEHEDEFDNNICPHGDIEYFYVINVKRKTFTGYWCMSWDVPDSDFVSTIEDEKPTTTDLAEMFSVPFGTPIESINEIRSKRKKAIANKLDNLKRLVNEGQTKERYVFGDVDERIYDTEF